MRTFVTKLIESCLSPDRIPDREDRRRGWVLISGSLLLSALGVVLFVNTLRSPTSRLVNYVGVGGIALVFALVPVVVRYTGRIQMAGGWAVGWAAVLLAALAWTGGLGAPALPWILLLPLLAHFFVGRTFAFAVLFASLAFLSAMYAATLAGYDFQSSYQADQLARLRWLSGAAFAVTATATAALYDDARRRALRLQEQINAQLRETNERLAQARDMAEATTRAKTTFLATVSHELRTPLHGVLAMTDALRSQPLGDGAREQVAIAERSAQTLKALIEDLLHLSEIEAGEVRITPAPWPVRRGIADLVQIFQPEAEAKGLALRAEISPDVPAEVKLDPLRVQQVVANLLGNAVKFTETGEVVLRCRWRPQEAGAQAEAPQASPGREGVMGDVILSVSDTGPGVPPAEQEKIFAPFVRGDDTATRRHGGTGLGLAISRELTERMGGALTLSSDAGAGSVFTVELPCEALTAAPVEEAGAGADPGEAGGEQGQETPDHVPQILVADDSIICQQVLLQLLKPSGYGVKLVSNGQEALDALAEQPFDVVLMDCEMPQLDGISAVRQLREREAGDTHTVVVAVTAHGLDEHRAICLEAGMDDVMAKPFRLADLEVILQRWLPQPAENLPSEVVDA